MTGVPHAEASPPEPLKFERRSARRHGTQGVATAFCLDGEHFGDVHDLIMLDYGAGGIGAVTDRAIEPGTMISLGFAKPGWLARRGVVKRCTPCGDGYRLAIQFQMGLAA